MDVRSARLYGQFSLDKTLTLQAGATVSVKVAHKVPNLQLSEQKVQGELEQQRPPVLLEAEEQ